MQKKVKKSINSDNAKYDYNCGHYENLFFSISI